MLLLIMSDLLCKLTLFMSCTLMKTWILPFTQYQVTWFNDSKSFYPNLNHFYLDKLISLSCTLILKMFTGLQIVIFHQFTRYLKNFKKSLIFFHSYAKLRHKLCRNRVPLDCFLLFLLLYFPVFNSLNSINKDL